MREPGQNFFFVSASLFLIFRQNNKDGSITNYFEHLFHTFCPQDYFNFILHFLNYRFFLVCYLYKGAILHHRKN